MCAWNLENIGLGRMLQNNKCCGAFSACSHSPPWNRFSSCFPWWVMVKASSGALSAVHPIKRGVDVDAVPPQFPRSTVGFGGFGICWLLQALINFWWMVWMGFSIFVRTLLWGGFWRTSMLLASSLWFWLEVFGGWELTSMCVVFGAEGNLISFRALRHCKNADNNTWNRGGFLVCFDFTFCK